MDSETVKPGHIYLAPGGRHMRVAKKGAGAVIVLDDGPAVNFCKPAVDPLFTSAIDVWQGGVLAVILTGMGSDGMRGGKEIVAAGGNVIAQDEASSVVWGMPAQPRMPEFARPFCRFNKSVRNWFGFLRETVRDTT